MGARLGQHFLVDEGVRDSIVAAARLGPQARVLEIGSGRGALTGALLERCARLVAVEKDERLAAALAERLGGGKASVIAADFLRFGLETLGEDGWTVVGNLPYAVGAPILQKILAWPGWTSAVLMFQKEVALRVAAGPGGPDYGLLTLSTAIAAEAELVCEAPRRCFSPPPRVDSAVVRLVRRPRALVEGAARDAFFRVAKAAFSQRRKKAASPISGALGLPRERVEQALASCGVPVDARAERIPLSAYLALPGRLGP